MDLRTDARVASAGVSGREAEVLAAVGRRLTNREIAAELFISVRTVESHIAALLRKLEAPDRSALVDMAMDAASRATIPRPLTSFVGRVDELRTIRALLEHHPLVTLLGPGGCGKTRLAQEVAISWPGEVRIVDLAPLAPGEVESAVVDALQLGTGSSLTGRARIVLAGRSVLLVLDNSEHLIEEAGSVATLLIESAPGLRVLAGSRQALGLPAETVVAVGPLPLPVDVSRDAVETSPAGRLFLDRAASACGIFDMSANLGAVASLCKRLDGLPLAIELAASSLRSMSIEEVVTSIRHHGNLPEQKGRQPRHRTMEAAIDWSWSRLRSDEAALLSRLSVLPGHLVLDELLRLEPMSRPPVTDLVASLSRLVDQSMVVAHIASGDPTRYDLLETIRSFGSLRIEETEAEAIRQAFALVQRDLLAISVVRSRSPDPRVGEAEGDRRKAVTALAWATSTSPGVAQDLLVSIASRYELDPSSGMLDGVRDVVERHAIPDDWPAPVLAWAGLFLNYVDIDLFLRCAQLAVERAVNDEQAAVANWATGFAWGYHQETERALTALARATEYFSASGDRFMVAHCEMARGVAETEPSRAVAAFERSMLAFLDAGASWHANSARLALVRIAIEASIRVDEAARLLDTGLKFAVERGLRHDHAHAQLAAAHLATIENRVHQSRSLAEESALSFRQVGDLRCLGRALQLAAVHQPTPREAIRLNGEALQVALIQSGRQAQITALEAISNAALAAGDLPLAGRAFGALGILTGEPPSIDSVIGDRYRSFILEGEAGGPAIVLSQM